MAGSCGASGKVRELHRQQDFASDPLWRQCLTAEAVGLCFDCSRNRGPTLVVLAPRHDDFFGSDYGPRADGAMQSDRHAVSVEFVILVVATFARAKIGEIVYELNGCNPLDHLEA